MKKSLTACLGLALLASSAFADMPSEHWRINHEPGGYCEEIYREDEYNCLDRLVEED